MENTTATKLKNILVLSVAMGAMVTVPTYALSSKPKEKAGAATTETSKERSEKDTDKTHGEHPTPKGKPGSLSHDISKGFSAVAQKAIPTVVNVSTTQIIEGRDKHMPQFAPGSPFDELFKDFFDQMEQRPRRVQSLGSGFLVKSEEKDGHSYAYVVTNFHVIADAKKISIVLYDNTELDATIHAVDERTDVALLKVDTDSLPPEKRKLQVVEWGNSKDIKVGDWCVAIGNPYGLGSTVTSGIVSNISRNIGLRGGGARPNLSDYVDDFIQHDAPINMGNSGGPLFDLDGNVIGVNSAIYSPSGGNVGIGFAIPSSLVEETIDQLIEFGRTKRGWLGVKIQVVTDEFAESLGFGKERGAAVSSVTPKGPAAMAGIEPRDFILEFDGKAINDKNRLQRVVGETEVGKKVKVKLLRRGKDGKNTEMFVDVVLGEFETSTDSSAAEAVKSKKPVVNIETKEVLGIKLSAITGPLSQQFEIKENVTGAVVVGISSDSPAAAFLKAGDVITEVNQVEVKSPEEVLKAVEDAKAKKRKNITFFINRSGDLVYATIKSDDDLKDTAHEHPQDEAAKPDEAKPEGGKK